MVRGVEHEGVAGEPRLVQGFEHLPDQGIEVLAQAVVRGPSDADPLFGQRFENPAYLAKPADGRRLFLLDLRHVDVLGVIVVEFLGRDEGAVGKRKTEDRGKGPVLRFAALAKILDRLFRPLLVAVLVRCLPSARVRHTPSILSRSPVVVR